MVTYPIHIPVKQYRGSDQKKRSKHNEQIRIARDLERLINDLIQKQQSPIQQYLYYDIAKLSGHTLEIVRNTCFAIDAGHNGFTAIKPGMTLDQALKTFDNDI
jgi:hypothetical protein